ncbi:cytochrome bc complex cytochrome b subunit [bacterium]|nr:cytochrome bc complex cytochrome b subunit [bacterium]
MQSVDKKNWFAERIPVDWNSLKHFTNEPVPNHLKRWWFALGGTPAYLFMVQLITGIFLTFYYVPTPEQAFESITRITYEIRFGWFIRGLHMWSANLMVIAVILHMLRVFFTGSYRKPRELNWIVGVCILLVTVSFGFTGYSLIYEQLSYWAATVGTNIAQSVPVVGPFMAAFIRGGEEIGPNTLTRFFVFHIGVLPTVMFIFVSTHIFLVRTTGVTEFKFKEQENEKEETFPFFPNHLLTELIIGLLLMYILTMLVVIFPPEMHQKANPLVTPEHIKPEWYFFASFRWLKLNSLIVGIIGQAVAVILIMAWPWIDKIFRRKNENSELSLWIGVAGFLAFLALTVWEAMV